MSQGSSGNEYTAVNCRGVLRCSAARTCDGCETRVSFFFFFASCRSQVSLLPRLLIPKRREPEVQSQPTENLQVSAPRCWPGAQHSPTQSHLPGKASEQASKPTRAFKGLLTRQRGEPCTVLLWAARGCLCFLFFAAAWTPPALPDTFPAPTHTQSTTGRILLTHPCSRGQHPWLCSPLVPQAPWSKHYPPVTPSLLQGREHQIAPAKEKCLFSQICLEKTWE